MTLARLLCSRVSQLYFPTTVDDREYLGEFPIHFIFLGSVPASIHHFVRVRVHVCICACVCGQQIFLATLNDVVQRRML